MKYIVHTVLIAVLFVVGNISGYAQKSNLYSLLQKEYGSLTSLSAVFSEGRSNIETEITAAKGNKFVLRTNNRVVYCDGSTIWNVDHAKKKVMISSRSEHNSSASIDALFFAVLQTYKPVKETASQHSSDGATRVLHLQPSDESHITAGVRSVSLHFDRKKNRLLKIHITTLQGETEWLLRNIRKNFSTSKIKFSFKPPKDYEAIDLR